MQPPPVQYVQTSDGYRIAYAASGIGRPLVLMPSMFSHIQIYWNQSTFVLPWLQGLAARFRLIQYDGRGQGMSGRGLASSLALTDLPLDLEAVADRLALDRFVLLAFQWYGHAAVRYTIRHPDRVSALILACSSVSNLAWPMAIYETLAAQDWDAFLRSQAAIGQAAETAASIHRLRQATNQADWLVIARAAAQSDLTELLPQLQIPTLVLHPRDFFNLPPEQSMELAARIPNARVVLIDGATFGDAAQGIRAIESFLADLAPPKVPQSLAGDGLSTREVQVLRLIAAGKSNPQIADALVISLNTVQRHVSNIFGKIGATNRTEAAGYARERGLL